QVGAAKIAFSQDGLAEIQTVQVATGSPLVDDLPDQSGLGIHKRVGVEFCAAQVREAQNGVEQVGAAEIGPKRKCSAQVRPSQVRPAKIRVADVRKTEIGPLQIAARGPLIDDFPHGPPLGIDERVPVNLGVVQRGETQVRVAQHAKSQVGATKAGCKQSGSIQICKAEIGARAV